MRRLLLLTTVLLLLATSDSVAQVPEGFRWLNIRTDIADLARIATALQAEKYTAIREVGIEGGFALVFTTIRDENDDLPSGDLWTVYSVPVGGGQASKLLSGYILETKAWLKFESATQADLGIFYLDCWACEPASIFTAIHLDPKAGWRARWANKKSPESPGIAFLYTDVGDPYTDDDVDQVFAVFAPHEGAASVGTWYHAKDLTTGKLSDTVVRYWVDPVTGKDKLNPLLSGVAATEWKLKICKAEDAAIVAGQTTQACKSLRRKFKDSPQ